ncbi:glycosyltransferase [Jeotgalibacillus malaysiensis]|uniref:glycosyltransferase n=1 Tax=Jeotgalibacillus malaysiensis TaxID=1508404 RepID=UPI00384BCADB
MKKKLLFTIDSLACAGAEKSLVTLLGLLDYTKYEVDLMLFSHGNELEELVPDEVKVLPPLDYSTHASRPLKESLKSIRSKKAVKLVQARINYSLKLRYQKAGNIKKARLYWQSVRNVIDVLPDEYDVAIAYAQGVPTFYTAEKVKAKKKLAWVNVSYVLRDKEHSFQKKYYSTFDKIVAVSESAKTIFMKNYPEFEEKMTLIYDINNPDFINKMADQGYSFQDQFDGIRLLTIGRLASQKGYDLALKTCRILKDRGLHFRWYALGKGPLEEEIKEQIKSYGLEEHFKLLGVYSNPYPFIKASNLYVQTSRFEGFGLAIAEARMLNVPVVTTEFDAVYDQMIQGKNGIVVDMNEYSIAEGILKMLNNQDMYNNIKQYLIQEKKGNKEEISKFYQLI